MLPRNKKLIQSFILPYLEQNIEGFKITGKNGKNLFKCPLCKDHPKEELTANIFPPNSNKVYCFDPQHKNIGDIFDMVKIFEPGMKELSEDEIGEYLVGLLKIKTNDEIQKTLVLYESLNWSLVPLRKGGKEADVEAEWQLKEHRNKREWEQWVDSGLNLGVNCGLSNLLIVDIDAMDSKIKKRWYAGELSEQEKEIAVKERDENVEKVLNVLGRPEKNTLYQKSLGGIHLFFIADSEITKTYIDIEGVHVDIETGGAQIVLEPSVVCGESRKIYGEKVLELPKNIKERIIKEVKLRDGGGKTETKTELTNDEDLGKITGLNGKCNSVFVKVLGQFRKFMAVSSVERSAYLMNEQMLDSPMDKKSVRAMVREIEKYHKIDMEELSNKVLERLEKIEEATIRDLTYSLRQEQKDIEDCLRYLCDKDLIYRKGNRYKLIPKIEWRTDFLSVGQPINFNIPWFSKYARFDDGNMILLGGKPAAGKTTIVANTILQFKEQGIKPCVISSERGSKLGLACATLGIKEGDYEFFITVQPWLVPFKKNAVTIIDWLKPPNSDYAKTDLVYEKISGELTNKGGIAIVFAQLRRSTGEFFATDQIDQYAALCAYFRHPEKSDNDGNIIVDNENPSWETRKIRDSKNGQQIIKIPLTYDRETKRLIEK